MVIWLIGLAGAGKTVIGREVFKNLKAQKANVVFLDGDHVRAIMGNDLGYSIDDRLTNAWRICRLCQYLDDQGIDVVCAILSIFHETQEWNRKHYTRYFEVYLDVPMEVLEIRDQKGLYSQAKNKQIHNVVGVDIPFPAPACPDMVLKNGNPARAPADLAAEIIQHMNRTFSENNG